MTQIQLHQPGGERPPNLTRTGLGGIILEPVGDQRLGAQQRGQGQPEQPAQTRPHGQITRNFQEFQP